MPKIHTTTIADAQLRQQSEAALKRSYELLWQTAPLVKDLPAQQEHGAGKPDSSELPERELL